jgi:Nitroreductase family
MNSSLMRGVLLSSIGIVSLLAIFGCKPYKGTVIMTNRSSQYPILDAILHRWSPRAMSGEPISQEELMTILEAARWAPSSYNNQPWHFVYGIKGTRLRGIRSLISWALLTNPGVKMAAH